MTDRCPTCLQPIVKEPGIVSWGGWELCPDLQTVNGRRLQRMEFKMMLMLVEATGRVVTIDKFWTQMYERRRETGWPEDVNNIFRVMICKIKKKIPDAKTRIITVWHTGYRLEART